MFPLTLKVTSRRKVTFYLLSSGSIHNKTSKATLMKTSTQFILRWSWCKPLRGCWCWGKLDHCTESLRSKVISSCQHVCPWGSFTLATVSTNSLWSKLQSELWTSETNQPEQTSELVSLVHRGLRTIMTSPQTPQDGQILKFVNSLSEWWN